MIIDTHAHIDFEEYFDKFDKMLENAKSNNVEKIIIPESVTEIGDRAFEFCFGLKKLTIKGHVETLKENTFYRCEKLQTVEITGSVKHIERSVFYYAYELSDVSLPASLATISDAVFYYCGKLENITYAGTKDQWQAIQKSDFPGWDTGAGPYTIHCTDGDIVKSES